MAKEIKNDRIKQAIILAAGSGTRMKSRIPKPLLTVHGKMIIEHKLQDLQKHDVDVCLVINPKDEQLFRDKLKNYDLKYCYQKKALGTGNAVYAAKDFINSELFLVMMGDDLVEFDVKSALQSTKPIVFGYPVNDLSKYGALLVNKNGTVSDIIEKRMSGKGLANSGVYIMPRKLFTYYDELRAESKKTEEYLTYAVKVLSKHGLRFKLGRLRKWYGINTQTELFKAHVFSLRDSTSKMIGLDR